MGISSKYQFSWGANDGGIKQMFHQASENVSKITSVRSTEVGNLLRPRAATPLKKKSKIRVPLIVFKDDEGW